MKYQLPGSTRNLVCLSLCLCASALSLSANATVVISRTAACSPTDMSATRQIQLRHYADASLYCDVLYAKPDEGGTSTTMWQAKSNSGYCESRFDEFVEKHQRVFGWRCSVTAATEPEQMKTELPVASVNGIHVDELIEGTTWVDASGPALTEPGGTVIEPSFPDATAEQQQDVVQVAMIDDSVQAGTMFPGNDEVSQRVREIAANLESQKIDYNIDNLSDCSGVFHRVLHGLQKWFPGIDLPGDTTHRSTRKLAEWYHERNLLELVDSAVDQGDAIQPGVVLYFGQPGAQYDDHTPSDLMELGTGIAHMGIVVDVERVEGRVVGYSLFHGRRTGTTASVTNYHRRAPNRDAHPPYGNGNQQWVAYSPVLPIE